MSSQTGQSDSNGGGMATEKPNGDQNAAAPTSDASTGEKQAQAGRMTRPDGGEVTPEKQDQKRSTMADKLKQKIMPPDWVLSNAKQLKVR